MPYVNIQITKDGTTKEQKRALIHGVSQVLSDVLGKHPKSTYVVITEVELEDWGVGGKSLAQYAEEKDK